MNRTLHAAVAVLLLAPLPTPAHHAFSAEYDANKLVTVTGVVANFEWINPHAMLYIEGKDANGKPGSWTFEMGSPGGLERRGWKKTDLKNGDQITVDGYASKDGRNAANVRMVTLPDGRKLFGGFQSTPGNPYK